MAGELTSNPHRPAPSTDVWLTHWVLTGKHVPCLSEDNPVVLRAMQPGEVAGRIVDCNINFCLIIDASEEWKKTKQDTQLFCCFCSFISWSKAEGWFFVPHFSGILCYRNERKKLFIKVRPLRRLACRKTSFLGEMVQQERTRRVPWLGRTLWFVSHKRRTSPTPWQCPGRQEMQARRQRLSAHQRGWARHLGLEAQQRSQRRKEPVRSRALPSVSKIR